jgi:3-deoxy-D-manno-octulosonate 8-phosphate phosphatase (KDO 8-P phosphatase)
MNEAIERARKIKLLIFDVDGVLTDGRLILGDDVVDLPPMRRCGLAVTVPASPALVKQHAHFVTSREAGRGAAREVCELIMQAQGTYDAQMAQYLR